MNFANGYPFTMLQDIGIDITTLPDDFYPTLNYVLSCVADERGQNIICTRYKSPMYSLDDIGQMYGITRQRVDSIVKAIREKLSKAQYKEMLTYGLTAYMELNLANRIDQFADMVTDDERNAIEKEAYARGYENGKRDALSGRDDNKADLSVVREIAVDSLPFSVRATNCFRKKNIKTLGDIIDLGDKIMDIRNFGKTTLSEIIEALKKYDVNVHSVFPRSIEKYFVTFTDSESDSVV